MKKFSPNEYWDNRLAKNYSLKGVGDIGLPVSYNEALYRVRQYAFKQVLKSLDRLDITQASVLDVGSGTGFYIDQWQKYNPNKLVGSDLTPTAVNKLTEKYLDQEFIQQDIGNVLNNSLKNNKFDVITAFDMLFHIVDDNNYQQAISNFSQLLKNGGYLIISDNLSPAQSIKLEHQVSREEKYVFDLLKSHGFELVKILPMFMLMNDPVRTKNRLLKKVFNMIYRIASKGEIYGSIVGGLVYPIEVSLIKLFGRGPSTEIFVFLKKQ